MKGYLICRSPSGKRNHTPTSIGVAARLLGHLDPAEVALDRLVLGQDEAGVVDQVRATDLRLGDRHQDGPQKAAKVWLMILPIPSAVGPAWCGREGLVGVTSSPYSICHA